MITDNISVEVEYILECRTPNSGKDWAWFEGCKPSPRWMKESALELLKSVRSKGYPIYSDVKHEFRLVREITTTDYGDPNGETKVIREVLND